MNKKLWKLGGSVVVVVVMFLSMELLNVPAGKALVFYFIGVFFMGYLNAIDSM